MKIVKLADILVGTYEFGVICGRPQDWQAEGLSIRARLRSTGSRNAAHGAAGATASPAATAARDVDVLYTDTMGKEAGCEKSRQSVVTSNLVFAPVSSVESDDDIGRVQFLGRAEKCYALN